MSPNFSGHEKCRAAVQICIHKLCLRGDFEYLSFLPYGLRLELSAHIRCNPAVIQTALEMRSGARSYSGRWKLPQATRFCKEVLCT